MRKSGNMARTCLGTLIQKPVETARARRVAALTKTKYPTNGAKTFFVITGSELHSKCLKMFWKVSEGFMVSV
jgi:hypothetical protein